MSEMFQLLIDGLLWSLLAAFLILKVYPFKFFYYNSVRSSLEAVSPRLNAPQGVGPAAFPLHFPPMYPLVLAPIYNKLLIIRGSIAPFDTEIDAIVKGESGPSQNY